MKGCILCKIKVINNIAEYVKEKIERGELKVKAAAKTAKILARPGIVGEVISTVMKSGLEKTKNVVKLDPVTNRTDMVVTNPSGEQYIVPWAEFHQNYDLHGEDGEYAPVITPDAMRKIAYLEESISFTAPWGETMNIEKGGVLVILASDNIYGIQRDEFIETYRTAPKSVRDVLGDIGRMVGSEKSAKELGAILGEKVRMARIERISQSELANAILNEQPYVNTNAQPEYEQVIPDMSKANIDQGER